MNRNIILIACICFYCDILAQSTFFKDINKDTKMDKVVFEFDSDIKSDITALSLFDGSTNENIILEKQWSNGSFISFVYIDKRLITWKYPLTFFSSRFFGTTFSKHIDPSLNWLLNSEKSNIHSDKFYEYKITYEPKWSKISDISLQNYHIKVKSSMMYNRNWTNAEVDTVAKPFVWINYLGLNHGVAKEILSDTFTEESIKLHKTNHGIFICRGDSISWIFISDSWASENHDKLRWPSILKAIKNDNYVCFLQKDVIQQKKSLFICNYLAGEIYKLNPSFYNIESFDDFEFKSGKILVNGTLEINLKSLFEH